MPQSIILSTLSSATSNLSTQEAPIYIYIVVLSRSSSNRKGGLSGCIALVYENISKTFGYLYFIDMAKQKISTELLTS